MEGKKLAGKIATVFFCIHCHVATLCFEPGQSKDPVFWCITHLHCLVFSGSFLHHREPWSVNVAVHKWNRMHASQWIHASHILSGVLTSHCGYHLRGQSGEKVERFNTFLPPQLSDERVNNRPMRNYLIAWSEESDETMFSTARTLAGASSFFLHAASRVRTRVGLLAYKYYMQWCSKRIGLRDMDKIESYEKT